VIVKPRRPPQDVAFSHRLYEQVEEARVAAARAIAQGTEPGDQDPLAGMTVKYGGGYMIAVDDSDLIKGDIWWNAIGPSSCDGIPLPPGSRDLFLDPPAVGQLTAAGMDVPGELDWRLRDSLR
jgi:hypothetical protein